MSREKDLQGLGELNTQIEIAKKARDRSMIWANLGIMIATGGGFLVGDYLEAPQAMLAVVLGGGLIFVVNLLRNINYRDRLGYLEGEMAGIQKEAQRTSSLQNPLT